MDKTETRLSAEDQEKVNRFISTGINSTERSSFKPLKLMLWLAVIIVLLGVISRVLGVFILG
ncbi:DUF3094 family protein [Endozoicomonas sp. OPT23]|uniref:DUF3094 family protein n=1 Tax=Endozoicomonas sp. OPT23 TaxID=2072845 RepID=UPI001890E51E|nr:DUF3094 family protein [Endozoicomonas sp. OPT23]